MKFRETIQEDIDFMAKHSVSRGIFDKQPAKTEFHYTLEHEGKVMGIGGAQFINCTTAWFWFDVADCAKSYMITGYRVVRDWLDIIAVENGVRRAEAYVECDFDTAIATAERLGFHRESTMENFVGDKPAHLYVKFYDGTTE